MQFLVDAVFSTKQLNLLGVLLVDFDINNYRSRPSLRLYSTEELSENYNNMEPRGFVFEEPGILRSDSSSIRSVKDTLFDYVKDEYDPATNTELDIVDFILLGVESDAMVITNPKDCLESDDIVANAIVMPFSSLEVSKSSFNIYGRYRNKEGLFRTFSLLDYANGSSKEFYCIFDESVDLTEYNSYVSPVSKVDIDGNTSIIYKVNLGLKVFYYSVGEAFLNYLAYNVAFFDIGEKTLRLMQKSTNLQKSYLQQPKEEVPEDERRKVSTCVIEHSFKNERVKEILSRISKEDSLVSYIKENPEAGITYQWLIKLYNSPWFTEGNYVNDDERIYSACWNLLNDCRKQKLKFALELLTHRYYLMSVGTVNDFLGPVLKGGGVNGKSVKRFIK